MKTTEMADYTIAEITVGTPLHTAQLIFRGQTLRTPLGLDPATAVHPREAEALHLIALSAAGAVIGCVSLLPLGEGLGKLFQMAVDAKHQREGIGRALVQALEKKSPPRKIFKIEMNARQVAFPFYQTLGYETVGEEFEEVGVVHKKMRKTLTQSRTLGRSGCLGQL